MAVFFHRGECLARFGRMVRIRRCWSPAPQRPMAPNGYEGQFVYAYGAMSPIEGEMDWMICRVMNTEKMRVFLHQISQAHPGEFILMAVDGASSHISKDLWCSENNRLIRLPPYSPEFNPHEYVWDELRDKEFPNRRFNEMAAVEKQLAKGLARMSADTAGLRSLPARPWIVSLILKANKGDFISFQASLYVGLSTQRSAPTIFEALTAHLQGQKNFLDKPTVHSV